MASLYDSIRSMERKGTISRETAEVFRKTPDRLIQMPPLNRLHHDPVFVSVLIDQSGSMKPLRDSVIETHAHFLEPLRKSAQCRHNALFIAQYLFNAESKLLNSFKLLSENGNDEVVPLSKTNYEPDGSTALFKTVYQTLQDVLMTIDSCGDLFPEIHIVLITDGEDTVGGVRPSDIKRFLDELRKEQKLGVSVVLGIISNKFAESQLESIRTSLGFESAISAQATEKELRRTMKLPSQSIVDYMGRR